MNYKQGLQRVLAETTMAGADGGVWGDESQPVGGDMQGDHIYAPGNAMMVLGNDKPSKAKRKRKRKTNIVAPLYRRAFSEDNSPVSLDGVVLVEGKFIDLAVKVFTQKKVDAIVEGSTILIHGDEGNIQSAISVISKIVTEEVFESSFLVLLGEMNLGLPSLKNKIRVKRRNKNISIRALEAGKKAEMEEHPHLSAQDAALVAQQHLEADPGAYNAVMYNKTNLRDPNDRSKRGF